MAMRTYGQIAITNITQVGELKVIPMSNLPVQVTFNPDNDTCSPDWSDSNTHLEIQPIVFLNGAQIESGYTVEFYKKDGASAEQKITATSGNEYVSGTKLTVANSSVIKESVSGIITYILRLSYVDPATKITLTNETMLSYSLLRNAATHKYVRINGENVFAYNSTQQIQGPDHFTLEAYVTGVKITKWQYRNGNGDFVDYPKTHNDKINGETLVIYENDNIFTNDTALIRVCTTDDDIYDLYSIIKVRDGAAGTDSISIVLSNDSHMIPCASDGTPLTYEGASTLINIFEGGVDTTDEWRITTEVSNPSKITLAYDQNLKQYNISFVDKTLDVATVTFTCTKDGKNPINTRWTITKVKAGTDGDSAIIYRLLPTTLAINKSEAGVFSPDKVTFRAKKRVGGDPETWYSGRFYIYESSVYNPGDSDWIEKSKSTADELSRNYIPTATAKSIKCVLLPAGSTDLSKEIDSQTVVITSDGAKGADGEAGEGGLSIVLGNEAELITCGEDGRVSGAQTITIPYTLYKGAQKVAGSADISGNLPAGMTKGTITNASASASGVITINVANNGTLGGADVKRGEINIVFTIGSVQDTKKFSWSKNIKAKDGANAVLLQVYAPQGEVIINGSNSVTLATLLTDGGTQVTSGITYKWYKMDGSSYSILSGKTASTLVVSPDMVDTLGYFKCVATYNSKEYEGYFRVTDRSDPYEVSCFSSIGQTLVNNDKPGAIFARVFQNGVEQDQLKCTTFSAAAPSGVSAGQYWYKLDSVTKTATLMKYSGSAWAEAPASDAPKFTYKWFLQDPSTGAVDTTTPWKTGKVIYFDNGDTVPTLNLICEVTA